MWIKAVPLYPFFNALHWSLLYAIHNSVVVLEGILIVDTHQVSFQLRQYRVLLSFFIFLFLFFSNIFKSCRYFIL